MPVPTMPEPEEFRLGFAARLIIGTFASIVISIAFIAMSPAILRMIEGQVPLVMIALVTMWAVASVARDGGGWRRANKWVLLLAAVVGAFLTGIATYVFVLIYIALFYFIP